MPLITKTPKQWAKDRIASFDEASVAKPKVQEAIGLLFPDIKGTDLADYTEIAFYLMTPGNVAYNNAIETDAQLHQTALSAAAPNTSISKLLGRMMQQFGFSAVSGVYLVGDAGAAFNRVVRNKMLFVDGISWVHGEFTHTIQWLYLCYARQAGTITTTKSIADLYADTTKYKPSPYTFWAEQGGALAERTATIWDFCVDCFVPKSVAYVPNLVENRFSNSARSPAWLQHQLLAGELLQWTTFGELLRGRAGRLTFKGKAIGKHFEEHPDELGAFYRERANAKMATKPKVFVPGTKTMIPDPTVPVNPATQKPDPTLGSFMHQGTGKITKKQVLAQPTGALLTEQEVQQLEQKAQKYKQGKLSAVEDDDGMWLQVRLP